MLISVAPNFQFVLSIANLYGGLCGSKEKTNRAIRSVSRAYSEMNRWILRKEESTFASVSKPAASLSKQTV